MRPLLHALNVSHVSEPGQASQPFTEPTGETREILEDELYREIAGATFFQRENPLVRHIVLRK